MKRVFVIICFFSMVVTGRGFAQICDSTLWDHVYNSYRLHVNTPCMTVSGMVYALIYEADGDIHIRLTVDSPFLYMLNAANYSGEYGKLVCETICATTVTQTDAIASCTGFTNTVYLPARGEHVFITGPYVTDNDHGWNEIHPITSITITSEGVNTAASPVTPSVSVFPNPASNHVTFKLSEKPSPVVHITILDEVGRLAGQYQLLETTQLDVTTKYLPSGTYYYHVEQSGKEVQSGSFAVQH